MQCLPTLVDSLSALLVLVSGLPPQWCMCSLHQTSRIQNSFSQSTYTLFFPNLYMHHFAQHGRVSTLPIAAAMQCVHVGMQYPANWLLQLSFGTHVMFSYVISELGSQAAFCSCVPTPLRTYPGLLAESHLLYAVPAASSVLTVEWGIRWTDCCLGRYPW